MSGGFFVLQILVYLLDSFSTTSTYIESIIFVCIDYIRPFFHLDGAVSEEGSVTLGSTRPKSAKSQDSNR